MNEKPNSNEVLTLEECRKQLGQYNLTDEQLIVLKNSLVGLVDSILNQYINDFR